MRWSGSGAPDWCKESEARGRDQCSCGETRRRDLQKEESRDDRPSWSSGCGGCQRGRGEGGVGREREWREGCGGGERGEEERKGGEGSGLDSNQPRINQRRKVAFMDGGADRRQVRGRPFVVVVQKRDVLPVEGWGGGGGRERREKRDEAGVVCARRAGSAGVGEDARGERERRERREREEGRWRGSQGGGGGMREGSAGREARGGCAQGGSPCGCTPPERTARWPPSACPPKRPTPPRERNSEASVPVQFACEWAPGPFPVMMVSTASGGSYWSLIRGRWRGRGEEVVDQ